MAARRLIVAMIALLVLSSVAAALIPGSDDSDPASSETTTTEATGPSGDLVRRTLSADAKRPRTIEIELGDQLVLRVTSAVPDQVEIRGLGELADVERDEPAMFDLLPFEPGRYPVRLLDAREDVGYVVVSERGRAQDGKSSNDSPGSSTTGSTAGALAAS